MYEFRTVETRIDWHHDDSSRRDVLDTDTGEVLGRVQIIDRPGRTTAWVVLTAGVGVPVDLTAHYPAKETAANAIVEARKAAADYLAAVDGLTGPDRAILDFADTHPRLTGPALTVQTRRMFNLSGIVYLQRLNALLDRDEALAYKPTLVSRLRRLRDLRRAARTGVTP